MDAIAKTWSALSLTKRLVLVGAVLATIGLVMMLARTAAQPQMALLYGGLDARTAGEVVTALEAMNEPVEVRGDAIFVSASKLGRLRMSLAQQSLPRQGQAGYEILQDLSGFGTTSEMFQAAYWRAKEGEIARTIVTTPNVRSARVHIGATARRPFQRGATAPTASVWATTEGGALTEQTALAIRFLVALSVPDLASAQVAVIDSRNGVVLAPGDDQANVRFGANGERRADALKADLERLIGVHVGAENVRVSVSVETTTETETISERLIDPDSQVTETAETQQSTQRATGGSNAVTVASNLPDGDAQQGGTQRQSETEELREVLSYRYSETRRDQVIEAGAVRRLGVAIMLNEVQSVGQDGVVEWRQRTAEELADIEALAKSSVAFDADRGDVVTVRSMRFIAPPVEGTVVEASPVDQFIAGNLGAMVQMLVLGVLVLALGLFVVRPILTAKAAEATPMLAAEAPAADAIEGAEGAAALGEDGVEALGEMADGPRGLAAPADFEDARIDPTSVLSDVVSARNEESVALLKKWLVDDDGDSVGKAA